MLDILRDNIDKEYSDYTNKNICYLGCDKERNLNSKHNCVDPKKQREEFKLNIYTDVELIKHKYFAKELVKICDGIKINSDNIIFVEITTPFVKKRIEEMSEKEKYEKIKKEFLDKIDGTKKIISLLIEKYKLNFSVDDIKIKLRPVFKPKPKYTLGQESYNIFQTIMLLNSMPIENFTVLKYIKCN